MSAPHFHGKARPVTASMILKELGNALSRIRSEDDLTWVEMGRLIGKSDDQAAKYADGSAEMSVTTYYFAKQSWNGRFTGAADDLIGAATRIDDRKAESCILKSALALSVALENGSLTNAEIRANRSSLEAARDAINGLLDRLSPREVAC